MSIHLHLRNITQVIGPEYLLRHELPWRLDPFSKSWNPFWSPKWWRRCNLIGSWEALGTHQNYGRYPTTNHHSSCSHHQSWPNRLELVASKRTILGETGVRTHEAGWKFCLHDLKDQQVYQYLPVVPRRARGGNFQRKSGYRCLQKMSHHFAHV